jgi:hypothetical protein
MVRSSSGQSRLKKPLYYYYVFDLTVIQSKYANNICIMQILYAEVIDN